MASANTLCKNLLNVKNTVVESARFYKDYDGVAHLRIQVRPHKRHSNDCPYCGRRSPAMIVQPGTGRFGGDWTSEVRSLRRPYPHGLA